MRSRPGRWSENALLGLGANGSLLLGSYWIARHGFKQPRGLSAALATAVVFWGACTVGLEVLGSFGALALGPMLAWGVMAGVIGGVVCWLWAEVNPDPSIAATGEPFSWDAVFSLALLLSAALVLGMRSLLLGVKVVSDGPIYHLYFAARWWKAGRLFLVASPFGENAATYFPANGDLWFTWLMATWGGDRLAKVGQAPFLVLASLAAYGCARRLGAGGRPVWSRRAGSRRRRRSCSFRSSPTSTRSSWRAISWPPISFCGLSQGAGDTAAYCLGALAAGEASGPRLSGLSLFLRSSRWRWWRFWSRLSRLEPRFCALS